MNKTILKEAHEIIYGDREKTYGDPSKNLSLIGQLWGAYLGQDISDYDVAYLMIMLKIARLSNTPDHRDSLVDICGYAALVDRIQQARAKTSEEQSWLEKVRGVRNEVDAAFKAESVRYEQEHDQT